MIYKKGTPWNKPKNSLMIQFEKETNKNSIYRGKITGQFEYWIYQRRKNNPKYKVSKEKNIFYNSLKRNYNKLKYPDGYIEIEKLWKEVYKDTYILWNEFSKKFWNLEYKRKFNIISKKQGLPIHGRGIDPEPSVRLYKLEF